MCINFPGLMFRMNGMPRVHGCTGAACFSFAQLLLDSSATAPALLYLLHPCSRVSEGLEVSYCIASASRLLNGFFHL